MNTRSTRQPNPRTSPNKRLGTPEFGVPRKPINILRMQDPTYKKISIKNLLKILMKEPNPDAGKSIVADVKLDSDEIDEAYNSLRKESLLL